MTEPVLVVHLRVAGGDTEFAAARLWSEGATAIEVRSEGPESILVAGFPTAEAARLAAERTGAAVEEIVDSTWQDAWRQFAEPVLVHPTMVVTPAWRPVPVIPDRLVIEIDPGACFGSGSHASTRAILGRLAQDPPAGLAVLDFGTGSGILAVAAARLGATSVVAVDIDPQVAAIAEANAVRNGVADRVLVGTMPAAGVDFDLAMVNVTAGVHAEVARSVVAAVRHGGVLLLAGLLPGQWQHVAARYEGCRVVDRSELDGWECLVLCRR